MLEVNTGCVRKCWEKFPGLFQDFQGWRDVFPGVLNMRTRLVQLYIIRVRMLKLCHFSSRTYRIQCDYDKSRAEGAKTNSDIQN